jgi:hypothetical protein
MKNIFLSILISLCYLPTMAQDGGHSLNTVFTTNELSENDLYSFEKRAGQKVRDLYSYLEIVSNPKTEIKLREEAKKQALELFAYKSCTLDGITVEKVLDSCMKITNRGLVPFATTTTITNKLAPGTDSPIYVGGLDFTLCYNSAHIVYKRADFMLVKTEKIFGNEKKEVWTILLCTISTKPIR